MRSGASNSQRRTRLRADYVVGQCDPKLRLAHWLFFVSVSQFLSSHLLVLCASDETEEEEVKPFRAPPGLSDSIDEEVKIRDPRPESHGCQTGVTAKAGS